MAPYRQLDLYERRRLYQMTITLREDAVKTVVCMNHGEVSRLDKLLRAERGALHAMMRPLPWV